MTKDEMFKLIDKEVDIGQKALDRIFKIIFEAGYNQAIEEAAKVAVVNGDLLEIHSPRIHNAILKLKK